MKGDPSRFRQVLFNLVGNAIKFTAKGRIEITASVVSADDHKIQMRFEVLDTGIGLSPAAAAKLFKPSTQADASTNRHYGGTGLGLTISKRLVELMHGTIGVESRRKRILLLVHPRIQSRGVHAGKRSSTRIFGTRDQFSP